MGVLDFGGDRQRRRGSLGVNLRRSVLTNGDFVASIELSFGVVSGEVSLLRTSASLSTASSSGQVDAGDDIDRAPQFCRTP